MSLETFSDPAGAADATGVPASQPPVLARVAEDESLSKTDLVEVIAHCASTIASAQFRLLTAISLIHEEHEEDYGVEIGELTDGRADSPEAVREFAARGQTGDDPRAQYGPNGVERTIADVGAVLSLPPGRARELIIDAHALRYRLPYTSSLLACGRIDLQRFHIAVARTSLCGPDTIDEVDARLTAALSARDHLSTTRFAALVDSVVAQVDAEAVKRRRARIDADRNVQVRPDRWTPGQSRLSGTVPAASGVLIDQRLTQLANSVHDADPRTHAQRRADALTAFANGDTNLACRCDTCTSPDASDVDTTEPTATPMPMPVGPRAMIHVVANQSTLDGKDDQPGYLDGVGVIDADTVRELAADATFDYLDTGVGALDPRHPDHAAAARAALRYVPSKKLLALVRSGELCCTFPGCTNPVWQADVDHSTPFDHHNPSSGGLTVRENLKPLCRFHHRTKTFGRWRDYQLDLQTAIFVSPTGHTFVGNAFGGLDLFPKLIPTKPPDHPARRTIDTIHAQRRAKVARAEEKWNEENPPPY